MANQYKFVKLSERTKILLNEVKSIIFHRKPKISKVTDDFAISESLESYKKSKGEKK